MRLRVLGPLEVRGRSGGLVQIGAVKQRLLLAVLLLHPNELVTTDRLALAVWPHRPPQSAGSVLRTYISALRTRAQLAPQGEPPGLLSRPGGYLVCAGESDLDSLEFERDATAGLRALADGEPAVAAGRLIRALALWRGRTLEDVPLDADGTAALARLGERRLVAQEAWIDARLRLGQHHDLAVDLHPLIAEHPLRERFWAQWMIALHRAGRRSDALRAYHELRGHLVRELAVEPSPPIQRLHARILAGDPALEADYRPDTARDSRNAITCRRGSHDPGRPGPAPRRPAQLPPDVAAFTGREPHLRHLDALLSTQQRHRPATVVISAMSGTAGVGKTALAVHWAHQVADRFPDGQLYVNLRGFDPGGAPMAAAAAVRRFLDALEVSPQRIPADPDAQTALYRTLLADRKMLILLDNARDAAQIRPLLPGAPRCMVLVTSRDLLSGLVAAEGAHPLTLDLLTRAEAKDLLTRRLGRDRVAAEPQAVKEIIAACARLPLALAIVAAHAATQPQLSLAALATDLHDRHNRLDALSTGDVGTDVRAVFSWSYHTLSPDAAWLFRLLGRHPGPDISAAAAASLAGLPPPQVRPLLAELTRANLLIERTADRYTLHDLLRVYATHLAHTVDPDAVRHTATARMLDHYLHTAHAADRLLYPARAPIPLTSPQPGVTPERPADHHQALTWFTVEHPVLLAAVDHAAATGMDNHTWRLVRTLSAFLYRRSHWHDLAATGQAAVTAARRLGDPTRQARAHRILARAFTWLGRFDDADTQLRHALDLHHQAGDPAAQAHTHRNLALVCEQHGRHAEAVRHARLALDLFRAAGHQQEQGLDLNAIGWCHALLGDHQQAITHCQQAIAQLQELGDHRQAHIWDSLGYAHHQLGQHTQAIDCYQRAIDLYRDFGDRYFEADTLIHLGDTHHIAGNPHAARDSWQHALSILDELDHPDADNARTRLANLDTSPRGHPTLPGQA